MSITKEELRELCAKLSAIELSDDQRLLLGKILKIAWDYAGSQRQLDAQFNGCFAPEEAEMIIAYPGAPANIINEPPA